MEDDDKLAHQSSTFLHDFFSYMEAADHDLEHHVRDITAVTHLPKDKKISVLQKLNAKIA